MTALRAALIAALAAYATLAGAQHARADSYYEMFQITCAPEINYFAIRSFIVELTWETLFRTNKLMLGSAEADACLREKHGLFSAQSLEREPDECHGKYEGPAVARGPHALHVVVRGEYKLPSNLSGWCGAATFAHACVTLNGHEVAALYPSSSCPSGSHT